MCQFLVDFIHHIHSSHMVTCTQHSQDASALRLSGKNQELHFNVRTSLGSSLI